MSGGHETGVPDDKSVIAVRELDRLAKLVGRAVFTPPDTPELAVLVPCPSFFTAQLAVSVTVVEDMFKSLDTAGPGLPAAILSSVTPAGDIPLTPVTPPPIPPPDGPSVTCDLAVTLCLPPPPCAGWLPSVSEKSELVQTRLVKSVEVRAVMILAEAVVWPAELANSVADRALFRISSSDFATLLSGTGFALFADSAIFSLADSFPVLAAVLLWEESVSMVTAEELEARVPVFLGLGVLLA